MLSSLLNKDNGASGELNGKIMNALGPVMAEHWPKLEPYANQALATAQDDASFEVRNSRTVIDGRRRRKVITVLNIATHAMIAKQLH